MLHRFCPLPLLTACVAYKKGKVWTALHRRIIDRLHRQTRQKIREIELSVEHETLAEVWRASMGNTGRAMLPVVLFAAPAIRNLTHILIRED